MTCKNCGATLAEDAMFCVKCGCKAEEGRQQKQQNTQQKTPVQGNAKAGQKKQKAVHTGISVVLGILVIVLGIGASAIFLLRHMVRAEGIDNAIEELEVSEARLRFLKGDDFQAPTVAELIQNNIDSEWREYLTDENLEKLLSEKFIKRFIADKINDYVEDLLKNTGDGIIETKDLEKLLDKNRDTIAEMTLLIIEEGEARYLAEQMEDLLEQTDLSLYRDENPQVFRLISFLGSYGMAALFLVLAVLALAGIFILQSRKEKVLVYLGICSVLVGATNFAAGAMTGSLVTFLNRSIGFGRSFWKSLLGPVKGMGMMQGSILVVAGVVACLAYGRLHKTGQKKERES